MEEFWIFLKKKRVLWVFDGNMVGKWTNEPWSGVDEVVNPFWVLTSGLKNKYIVRLIYGHISTFLSLVMVDRAVKMAESRCKFIIVLGVDFMFENVCPILDQGSFGKLILFLSYKNHILYHEEY